MLEVTTTPGTAEAVAAALATVDGVVAVQREGDLLAVECSRDVRAEVAREVAPLGLLGLRLRGVALEDIYLKYFRQGE